MNSTSSESLPRELCERLWGGLLERLEQGAVLITQRDFQTALEEEYTAAAGRPPTRDTAMQIGRMIERVDPKS